MKEKLEKITEKLAYGYISLEEVIFLIENLDEKFNNWEFWLKEAYETYNQLLLQHFESQNSISLN